MKKYYTIILILILLLLCGCTPDSGTSPAPGTTPLVAAEPTPQLMSVDEQKSFIESMRHVWEMDSEINSPWFYAFTDMDHNGRLEVICATVQGTGHFTYAEYYEVSEDFSGLDKLDMGISEYDNWADITLSDAICYYDSSGNVYHYVYESVTKVGATEYSYSISAISLVGGKLNREYLAGKSEIYTDFNSPAVFSYSSAAGEAISEEDYIAAADNRFAGLEKTTAGFEWNKVEQPMPELADQSLAAPQTIPQSGGNGPVITKNPSSETIAMGGKTWFIAHADGANSISWQIIDPSGRTMQLNEAMAANPGLELEALEGDTLALRNVPASFNNWAVQARFDGDSGSSLTTPAYIYVGDFVSAYSPILQKYLSAYQSGNTGLGYYYENELSVQAIGAGSLGYALKDMDKDGIPELIIAVISGQHSTPNLVCDLYTLSNGQPVKLLESQERTRLYMLTDNRLYYEGSGGAASQSYELFDLVSGQLVFSEGFSTTNSNDNTGTMIYHTTQSYSDEWGIYGNYDAYDAVLPREQGQPYVDAISALTWLPQLTAIY